MGSARTIDGARGQDRHPLAQLHGRVRELHDRRLTALVPRFALAAWIGLAVLALPARAPAQEASTDLGEVADQLASEDAEARRLAIERLRTLPASALPDIAGRLAFLRRARPTRDEAERALTAFRRATGSRRADDMVDLAEGIEAVLAERRDLATRRLAEPLLLLRSLEAIGTTEALRLVPAVLSLDGEPWRMEGRRVTARLNDRVAAAAILARGSNEYPEGRVWARWTTDRLGLDDPGALAQRLPHDLLAEVLAAYATTHTLSALPVIASFVDADQRRLREAAREGLRAYRQNGIWVARETFETRLGTAPDLRWGWERTLDELFARLDAARAAHVHAALEDASRALEEGRTSDAQRLLDAALLRSPDLATLEAAELYARMAERDGTTAAPLLRRAIAIAPDAPSADTWRGRLTHLSARQALTAGVLDAERFALAARLAPSCLACEADHGTLTRQAASTRPDRTLPLALAAALFATLGLLLLVPTRPTASARPFTSPTSTPPTSDEAMATSPGLVSAEDTLG
jgi:hypothetical protein